MKIIFIMHDISPACRFIEEAIANAIKSNGVEHKILDIGKQILQLKNVLQKGSNNLTEDKAFSLAKYYGALEILPALSDSKGAFVFLINGHKFFPPSLQIAKKLGLRLISWQIDDPYWIDPSLEFSKNCDYIFTVDSSTLDIYKKNGCRHAFYLPLAFPKTLSNKEADPKYASEICFVGTPFRGSRRVELIDELAPFLAKHKTQIIGSHLVADSWKSSLKNYSILKDSIHEEYMAHDQVSNYNISTKINLNIHRDSFGHPIDHNKNNVVAQSPNDRTFILAGEGAFQLVDDTRPDLEKSFEIGKEIVTFSNSADLRKKIEYYLKHDDERNSIAKSAKQRVLAEHTYEHRIKKILESVT